MTWALFEDGAHEEFAPLGHTRALFDVKVGPLSRFQEHANPPEILLVRDYLHKVMEERHPGCEVNPSSADSGTVFINALADPRLLDFDRFRAAPRFLARSGGRIVAAKLSKNDSEKFIESVTSGGIFRRKFAVEENYDLSRANERVLISHPWEVIRDLKDALVSHASAGEPDANWKFIGKNPPKVHPSAKIEDGVVFDTTKGNIQIGAETTISPCRIVGPATIGERTVVKQYSIIETSAIGTDCRIAGEVEHSIISDYSNKAHAGFVGHSHVGEWVNLGAMTTTSDLKLTYGNVKMARLGRKIDTGMGKLGAFFGDMVKTSIGTLVYGGLRIGVGSHLLGTVSADVPSFSITSSVTPGSLVELELQSAIRTQERMMPRRNRTMTKAYKKMIEDIFASTAKERRKFRVRRAKFSG